MKTELSENKNEKKINDELLSQRSAILPEGWRMATLGEVAEINALTINKDYHFDEIEYIDVASVEERKLLQTQKLLLKSAPSRAKRIVRDNDILISTVRPNLKHYCFVKKSKPNLIVSTGFAVVSAKEADAYFLYNLLTTEKYTEYLTKIADTHTSTYPAFNSEVILNSKFLFPPFTEQRAIAAVLSSLDDKIELLREQNKTLEAVAQSLYKRWFVDFEFPNEEGKPYKSSGGKMVESEFGLIPIGWDISYLGDDILTSLSKTGIENFEGEKIYLDTAAVQGSNVINFANKISFKQRPSRANMQPKINSIWFAKMKNSKKALFFDAYSALGLNNFILSTGFAGLDVKEYALYYLWNFITDDKFELIKNNFCNGTTMEAINNENIRRIKILIPAKEILELFSNSIKPLYGKFNLNQASIQTLSAIRDALLPKLVSGKIRVSVESIEVKA